MMNGKLLVAFLLTTVMFALGEPQRRSSFEQNKPPSPEALWRFISTPKFRTIQGKVQVTVFLPEGCRSWTMDLWADENRSKVQFELPHPEGPRQVIILSSPDKVFVMLPFIKRAIQYKGSDFPSWRDMWQIQTDKLDMAKRNYTLQLVTRDRVGGEFCLVLQISPKVKGNPIRKIWIHPPTRLPLQVERYSPEGKLEARITLSEVKINEPLPLLVFDHTIPSDWTVERHSFRRQKVEVDKAREVFGFEPVLPVWVPPGYLLEGIFSLGDQNWKMAHIVYTDGMSVISVFQHPAPPKRRPLRGLPPFPKPQGPPFKPSPEQPTHERPPKGGAPFAKKMFPQRVVVREIGNLMVVLVSDVTQDWLERMADSMASVMAAR
ncbi:MAG: sigma-E factor regulatory protein RseB domain-containing protein [Candidatus Fervidibacter sp.]|uniref:sigma-E factor regulatory protein RseB domain-containing protein n=1 Tax=Candidatus Fervidibacter sp. TaxID=3100871 RepID=UPI00404B7A67